MDDSVKILFLGDFVVQNPNKIVLSNDFQELINDSDFATCNFEAVVSNDFKANVKSGPSIQQSEFSPNFLSQIGINMLSLANNHTLDFGVEGLKKTQSSMGDIITIGAGLPEEVYKIKVIIIKDIKIGFLALTQLEFGTLTNEYATNDVGTAWINHKCINSLIIDSKSNVDYLFVIAHAGVEDIEIPLPEWRFRYKELIDLGADAIIASHPHVPQGWEKHKGKPIFYSLGNFCFESKSSDKFWNIGLCVQLSLPLKKTENGITYDVSVVSFENNKISLIRNNDLSIDITNHLENICDILKNDFRYISAVNIAILQLWDNVYNFYFYYYTSTLSFKFGFMNFLRLLYNKIFRKQNNALMLNIISCESHRYLILRVLNLKNKL